MDSENNFAEMPYKTETKIIYDNYDLTNIRYYEHVSNDKINSRKMMLKLYVCNGQCCNDSNQKSFYKCKLEYIKDQCYNSMYINNCPYITLLLLLNEPRKNSANFDQWFNILNLFSLRKKYGLYTDYVYKNKNKNVSIEVYKVLKTIPEFSLKNVYHNKYDLEDIYKAIKENKEIDIKSFLPHGAVNHFEYSLLQCYKDDITEYRDFLTCRIFRDAEDIKYFEWKSEHKDYPVVIDIGEYYMFANNTYHPDKYISDKLFTISSTFKENDYVGYLSFKKSDIYDVIKYLQSHDLFANNFINRYTIEKLNELI